MPSQPNAAKAAEERDEDASESDGPPPPDGGWGWVVVFGSFMIHIVTDGLTYSFGVFYDEFLDFFKESKGATSWIVSILVGVTLCSGPISSAFVTRYGCRVVTIAGAILAALSLVASAVANSVTVLYVTVGLGTGLGFGMIYLPAIVSVTQYFQRYRSLATGIAVCGSGFGTVVFAPVTEFLIKEYGWRKAMAILAAVTLQCIIYGALFRPLEEEPDEIKAVEDKEEKGFTVKTSKAETDLHLSNHHLQEFHPISLSLPADEHTTKMLRPHSVSHFSMLPRVCPETNGSARPSGGRSELDRLAMSQPMLVSAAAMAEGRHHSQHHHQHHHMPRHGPLHRRDIFYQGSLLHLPKHKSEQKLADESTDLMQRRHSTYSYKRTVHSSEESLAGREVVCGCVPCTRETADTLRAMLDMSLLMDPIFLIFAVSNFLTSIGFNIPYVYIVSKATDLGIASTTASYLLSVIGAGNTVGRIVLGYVSDKTWVNRLWVYNVCLTVCGIATTLSAFCLDFTSLAVYGTIFGVTIGAYVGLTSVILVDLLGLNKLTNAFGLLLLFQGIASFIGPPMAGWMYDITGSYNPVFYLSGITVGLSGLILFFIPSIQRYQRAREAWAQQQSI